MKRQILLLPRWGAIYFVVISVGCALLDAADRPSDQRPPNAQPGSQGPPPSGGFDRTRGGGSMVLDDQQRQLYREALNKYREDLNKLEERLRIAQRELMQVTLAEQSSEPAIREKADAVAKIQSEMMVLRAKALATIAPTLKPEQREQLENSQVMIGLLTSDGMMSYGSWRGGDSRGGDPSQYRGNRDRGSSGGGGPRDHQHQPPSAR